MRRSALGDLLQQHPHTSVPCQKLQVTPSHNSSNVCINHPDLVLKSDCMQDCCTHLLRRLDSVRLHHLLLYLPHSCYRKYRLFKISSPFWHETVPSLWADLHDSCCMSGPECMLGWPVEQASHPEACFVGPVSRSLTHPGKERSRTSAAALEAPSEAAETSPA